MTIGCIIALSTTHRMKGDEMRYIYACPCEHSACAVRKDKVFHCDTCGKVWSEEEIIKHQPKYGETEQ